VCIPLLLHTNLSQLVLSFSHYLQPTTEFRPTAAPTSEVFAYVQLAEVQGPKNSEFGSAAAMSKVYAAVGAPATEFGAVFVYGNVAGDWQPHSTLEGKQVNGMFGISLDIAETAAIPGLLVGAPRVNAPDTPTPAGAAYYFEYNSGEKSWSQIGSPMQGGIAPENADEMMGASVAASDNYRVVVGAPQNNAGGLLAGRVYTFEFKKVGDNYEWEQMTSPINGVVAGEVFGSAVDMSSDGNLIVVGSPGLNVFRVFRFTDNDWEFIFTASSPSDAATHETFGSSVVVLSEKYVAVGGPTANLGAGVVRVYEFRESSGVFGQLGPDIDGETVKEGIGATGTLSGSMTETGPVLFVGTKTGFVKRLEYDKRQDAWIQTYDTVDTGLRRGISSLSAEGVSFVAGGVEENLAGVFTTFANAAPAPVPSPNTPTPPGPEVPAPKPSPVSTPAPVPAPKPSPVSTPAPNPSPVSTLAPNPGTPTTPVSPTSAPSPAKTDPPKTPANPTLAPTPSTPAPVTPGSPTPAPTPGTWKLTAGPLSGVGFGEAVALTEDVMAVGTPTFGTGAVQTYQKESADWNTLKLIPPENDGKFGAAIDLVVNSGRTSILVGAPEVMDSATLQPFGAAYYYELNSGSWDKKGSTLFPPLGVGEASGRMGASVAAATTIMRVAIGAPRTNIVGDATLKLAGRVYTYEFDSSTSDWVALPPIDGLRDNDALGTSVDISSDGSRVLAGAAGSGNGLLMYYQWDGSVWQNIFFATGETSSEALGSSVAILSEDGNMIAVGSPGFGGDQGRIQVYLRQSDGSFDLLGPGITGLAGEKLGASLSGAAGQVIAGTANGKVRRYRFDGSNWNIIANEVEVASAVSSVATTVRADSFVVGTTNQKVSIYDL